jgi:hypothetical protein
MYSDLYFSIVVIILHVCHWKEPKHCIPRENVHPQHIQIYLFTNMVVTSYGDFTLYPLVLSMVLIVVLIYIHGINLYFIVICTTIKHN